MYARSLSRLAVVVVVLYIVLLLNVALPVRLLDYSWINAVSATLINGAGFPLLGLFVLVVGTEFYPEDYILRVRRQLFSKLSILAALGFLFLIPANIYAGVLQQTNTQEQLNRLSITERQIAAYREAANQATSISDLDARLQKMEAPKLGPAERLLPLPVLKAQLSVVFDRAASQVFDQRQALLAAGTADERFKELMRISASCLVLTFGFAAFAQSSPTGPMLLDSIEEAIAHALAVLRNLRMPRIPLSFQFRTPGFIRYLNDLPYIIHDYLTTPRRRRPPRRRQYRPPFGSRFVRFLDNLSIGLPPFFYRLPFLGDANRTRPRRRRRYPERELEELAETLYPKDKDGQK